MNNKEFKIKATHEDIAYVATRLCRNRICTCCGHYVLITDNPIKYDFQCLNCDEDLNKCETEEVEKNITEEEFAELCEFCSSEDMAAGIRRFKEEYKKFYEMAKNPDVTIWDFYEELKKEDLTDFIYDRDSFKAFLKKLIDENVSSKAMRKYIDKLHEDALYYAFDAECLNGEAHSIRTKSDMLKYI